eukprot:COSAG03_NODE_81_length_14000_cov_112.534206_2_plen_113_part_00
MQRERARARRGTRVSSRVLFSMFCLCLSARLARGCIPRGSSFLNVHSGKWHSVIQTSHPVSFQIFSFELQLDQRLPAARWPALASLSELARERLSSRARSAEQTAALADRVC